MEEQLNLILKPSLKCIALRKVVTILWDQGDIKASALKFCFQSSIDAGISKRWYSEVDKVAEKLLQLSIPEALKHEGIGLIKPIGKEILKWKLYHEKFLSETYFAMNVFYRLCWTTLGTVDLKKTAEVLIADEHLDVIKRYKLACIYCLENNIPTLWQNMSENDRICFFTENPMADQMVNIWTFIMKGKISKFNDMIVNSHQLTAHQYAFLYAATSGNKIATEYFFQKLTDQEKEECLMKVIRTVIVTGCGFLPNKSTGFPKEYSCDVLCFLLSKVEKEQKIELLRSSPRNVLKCFLNWPWQDLFIDVYQLVWTVLDSLDFSAILKILTEDKTGYNYHKLFGKLWLQSPDAFKDYVFQIQYLWDGFFTNLFKDEDKENIKLVLRNSTAEQREKLISCRPGMGICSALIISGKWYLLELFVQECKLSKSFTLIFQERLQDYAKQHMISRKLKWDRFVQLLNNCCTNGFQKRCTENESDDTAKSFSGEQFVEEKEIARK